MIKNKLKIHSIETFGTHEGPGIRLVVFLQGCNFKCLYCHNPDTIDCRGGNLLSIEEILSRAENMKEYFAETGGITISGGEPCLQASAVLELVKQAHKKGFNVVLDTNGSIRTVEAKKVYAEVDLVLLDVKHFFSEEHKKLTGQNNESVLETLHGLNKKRVWLRLVLVPGLNDSVEHLESYGKELGKYKCVERLEILPYHTLGVYKYKELGWDYKLKNVNSPSEKELQKAKVILEKYFKKVVIR